MRFRNKVAIVTGSARGIGRATAELFAREGAAVTVADLREEMVKATAEAIRTTGAKALALRIDVGAEDDAERLVAETVAAFGRVDYLVNSAGIAAVHTFLDVPLAEFERVMRVNLTGTFLCGQRAARQMAKQGSGAIVNIASISGQRAGWKRTAYGTSKAAVIHLTKQMAMELGPLGIRVNAIGPGPIDTELVARAHTPGTRVAYLDMIPLNRYGDEQEIADAAAFLCSDAAAYVHGHTLNVDGGYMVHGVKFDD
ncbi:MAG: SDR family oxidoreductase [Alphaproteobacteria bacterium]|nr:SDR family oxidoreductase [Alphaproteobacteria bacterium]